MTLRSVTLLLTLLAGRGALAQAGVSYPPMSSEALDRMAGAFGFYTSQAQAVEMLAERFPDLRARLVGAQARFEAQFGASAQNIDDALVAEVPAWPSGRATLVQTIEDRTQIDVGAVSHADAEAFAALVEQRSRGEIQSPFLETLLIYRPEFFARPAEEFFRDYRDTFRTGDHPKAKGVDFQVEYPTSWAAADGRRPNVITMLTSEDGRGLESVVLLVMDVPGLEAIRGQVTAAELVEASVFHALVPARANLLSETPLRIDGLEAAKLVFTMQEPTVVGTLVRKMALYVVAYENHLITIQCGVASTAEDDIEDRFSRSEPLFDQIASSLVVQSQWGAPTPRASEP